MWVDGDLTARPLRPVDAPVLARWSDIAVEEAARRHFDDSEERVEALIVEAGAEPLALIEVYPSWPGVWQDVHGYRTEERPWAFDVSIGEESKRDMGYGSRIVRRTAEWVLANRDASKFVVDVATDNPRAVAAYEKAGFHKVRFLADFDDGYGPHDAWLMEFMPDAPPCRTMPTHVHYFKYDGSEHWRIEADLVADDEHGWWLRGYPGTRTWRGRELSSVEAVGFVFLVPLHAWWAGFWNFDRSGAYELYIDIATPAEWRDGELQLVDLDLDVVRGWDGSVVLLDEDEFVEHTRRYGYPDDVQRAAREAATSLLDAVARRVPPFDLVDAAHSSPWSVRG